MTASFRIGLVVAAAGLALAGAVTPAAAEPAAANATSCDRRCLAGFADQYLDALVAHDPARLQKAVDIRFTEDGQALPLGDGFWGTVSGVGAYRHYFVDPAAGQVALFATMREEGQPVFLVARLKVVDRKIAEIETIVPRDHAGPGVAGLANLERMGRPEAIWTDEVPPAERMSRSDLIRTANKYFTGLQNNRPNGDYSFFADDCDRIENGTHTTNVKTPPAPPAENAGARQTGAGLNMMALGCRAEFETGFFQMVTRIRDRRLLTADPETGTVFALTFFDHAGTVRQETLADGRTIPVDLKAPFTWEIGEAFKITGGKIRRVEAVMKRSPYGMKPGWPEDDLGYDPSTGPR